MTVQTINIGNIVNDGLGDDLRTAFQKVNANFADLSDSLTITASNLLGEELEGNVFKRKFDNNLEFKTLVAGAGIQFRSDPDSIQINSTIPDPFIKINTSEGTPILATDNPEITIQGGTNVRVSSSSATITVDTRLNLDQIFNTLDFGYLPKSPTSGIPTEEGNTRYDNILQFTASVANIDFGTYTNPAKIYIDLGEFAGV
jgi:hypothetical protein